MRLLSLSFQDQEPQSHLRPRPPTRRARPHTLPTPSPRLSQWPPTPRTPPWFRASRSLPSSRLLPSSSWPSASRCPSWPSLCPPWAHPSPREPPHRRSWPTRQAWISSTWSAQSGKRKSDAISDAVPHWSLAVFMMIFSCLFLFFAAVLRH